MSITRKTWKNFFKRWDIHKLLRPEIILYNARKEYFNIPDWEERILRNTPSYFDVYLRDYCPIQFIKDRLMEQCGNLNNIVPSKFDWEKQKYIHINMKKLIKRKRKESIIKRIKNKKFQMNYCKFLWYNW